MYNEYWRTRCLQKFAQICAISSLNIEMGQALLPQCRPCTATCFAHPASYPTTKAYCASFGALESQAPQRVTGLAQVDVFKREFACWTKQFSTGWGRVRTRRDNYFMACTGREKIKVFEMNQTLLLQCRPCAATCFAHLASYPITRAH